MFSKEKAFEIARATGWLSRQPEALQNAILSRSMVRSYAKGQTVCNVGDRHSGVFALVDGVLKVEFSTCEGEYRLASVKQPVFWFGQGASLCRTAFLISVTATTQASFLFLPHAEFEQIITDAAACRAFAEMTVEHFEEASQVIGQLLVTSIESRVTARLALLAERTGPERPAIVAVTQFDLAEMCGVSRPTVQLILAGLERRGIVRLGYRRIEVANPELLTPYGLGGMITISAGGEEQA